MANIGKLAAILGATQFGMDIGHKESYTLTGHNRSKPIKYFDSGKPISKRRKRRLRGKNKR